MAVESDVNPAEISRIDVPHETPSPVDCLPPGEEPTATAGLSPGWVAVTDRELVTYHPERTPAVERAVRANVTGLSVRRAGGRIDVGYLPLIAAYAVGALAFGVALLALDPMSYITLPQAPGVGPVRTVVVTFARGIQLFGMVLVFTGLLAFLVALAATGEWLVSRNVTLHIERSGREPIECATTRSDGTGALRTLADVFEGG